VFAARARGLLSLVRTAQLPFLAAALAYYAFLSVVPLLLVGFSLATALAGEAVATRTLTAVGTFLTPEAGDVLTEALVTGPGREGLTLVGVLVLLWGSLRVFRGLDTAFSQIYGVRKPEPFLEQLLDAVVVLVAIAVAIAVTAGVSSLPVLVGVSGVVGSAGLLGVLPLVFFPLYYVFPDHNVTVREAVPGTLVAAAGWTTLSVLFGLYTSYAGGFQLYGVLGGVLLLLLWFYFGGVILLVGVAVNVVLADRYGDRQLQQVSGRQPTQRATMGEADGPTDDDTTESDGDEGDGSAPGRSDRTSRAQREREAVTRDELRDLQDRLEEFESEIEDRTVHREELERDLKRYVRGRVRRGHATGWGPYLVLLYGTAMTLGAFYFLGGGWAILAMFVIWLSTLGLYTLMVLVGVTVKAVGTPGRLIDKVRSLR
jgi:membrane protein